MFMPILLLLVFSCACLVAGDNCDQFREEQCKILEDNLLEIQYSIYTRSDCQVE